jgi:DNA-binding MarR family transcriptional regulator
MISDETMKAAPDALDLPPAGRCNGTALRKASRRVSQLYDAVLAPIGLRGTQRSILIHIARAGRPSMGELAASLVLDRSALAHNLKPLERDGLIRIVPDDRDRRSRLVLLTETGRARLTASMPLWAEAQERFETAFGREEAAALRRALDRLAAPDFGEAFEEATRPRARS